MTVGAVYFEEKLIYFPSRPFDVTPDQLALRFENLDLVAEDGTHIHGWFLPAPPRTGTAGSNPDAVGPITVLVCHGNAGNVSHRLDRVLLMHDRLSTDVLLFDYRGFGRSSGRPEEQGTYRDARAAYRYLTHDLGRDPGRIILFGESLGAAVALQLATEVAAAGLVLEAPFTSIPDMAKKVYPFLPLAGLVRTRYDNLSKISGLAMPVLIFHGTKDDVVPFDHGERLFAAAREPKTFFPVEGAVHNDTYLKGGGPYWMAWKRFLTEAP